MKLVLLGLSALAWLANARGGRREGDALKAATAFTENNTTYSRPFRAFHQPAGQMRTAKKAILRIN